MNTFSGTERKCCAALAALDENGGAAVGSIGADGTTTVHSHVSSCGVEGSAGHDSTLRYDTVGSVVQLKLGLADTVSVVVLH